MINQLLYKEIAKYYDFVYHWKNYKKETGKIKKLIKKYKESDGKELLDVACGTGTHLKYLKSGFSCTGIDLNQGMLNVAKKNVKEVIFKKADMMTFNLNKKFDIITCLFGSIAYLKTYKKLEKTIRNFYKHLKRGGVVVIEGWISKSEFKAGHFYMNNYNKKEIKIARLGASKIKKGKLVVADMHFLIGEKGKNIKYFLDRHELGLFRSDKTLKLLKKIGFKAKFLKHGFMEDRGIYIGVKV